MNRLTVLVAAFIFTTPALAAIVNLSWVLPTQYVDNSTLAAADIASTTVEYGTCNGTAFGSKVGQVVAASPAVTAVVTVGPGTTYCYRAFVTTVAAKGGLSSAVSNVVANTVPFSAPKPPTLLDAIIAFIRRLFSHFA